MSAPVATCPRCASVVGSWHSPAECNARYDAAYGIARTIVESKWLDDIKANTRREALHEAADMLDRRASGGTAFNFAADLVRALAPEARHSPSTAPLAPSEPQSGQRDHRDHERRSGAES